MRKLELSRAHCRTQQEQLAKNNASLEGASVVVIEECNEALGGDVSGELELGHLGIEIDEAHGRCV
jgi:hypothetical protein